MLPLFVDRELFFPAFTFHQEGCSHFKNSRVLCRSLRSSSSQNLLSPQSLKAFILVFYPRFHRFFFNHSDFSSLFFFCFLLLLLFRGVEGRLFFFFWPFRISLRFCEPSVLNNFLKIYPALKCFIATGFFKVPGLPYYQKPIFPLFNNF